MSEVDRNLLERENVAASESESRETDLFAVVDRNLKESLATQSGLGGGAEAIEKRVAESNEALTEDEVAENDEIIEDAATVVEEEKVATEEIVSEEKESEPESEAAATPEP